MVPTDSQPPSNDDAPATEPPANVATLDAEGDDPDVSSWLAEIARAPSLKPKKSRRLQPGDIVAGRYVVLQVLGAGGMGVVYEATDTKLQRSIALKTHQCGSERARLKLLAEARAMAKLSHPNVVAVHDVGEFSGGVFLAADLVRGTTLRGWDVAESGWRETVRVYVDAGRGLAAAHALQLVHRDFKPENVLLDEDGRCYVTDFGLATLLGETAEAPSFEGVETISGERDKASTSRGWVGTPSYMAPEQFLRGRVDARSDQFSFCVALYEALLGVRPFGTTSLTLSEEEIKRAPPDAPIKLPRRIYQALRRGLQPDAAARFSSMEALLAELDAARRPKRYLSMAAVVLGSAGAALGAWGVLSDAETCARGDAPFSVWSGPISAELEATFAASDEAKRAWPAVERALDSYADDWRGSWREVCKGRGQDRPQVTVASLRCLEEARRDLDATVRRWRAGSPGVRANGLSRMAMLVQPTECLDPRFVAAAPVPVSVAHAAAVAGIRAALRQVHEDIDAGMPVAGLEARLQALRPRIARVQDAALDASLLWVEVALQLREEPAGAVASLKSAYNRARDGGDPMVSVMASATLGRLLAFELGKPEAGLAWAEIASAEARQDGVPLASAIEAELALAIVYDTAGLWTEADASYTAALERAKQLPPDTAAYTRAGILISVSGFEAVRGNADASLAAGREAVATFLDIYGGHSRESLNATTNIGLALHGAQRWDEAKALFEQEYRDRTLLFGPDDSSCIAVLINLGMVESALRNDQDARRYYAKADRVVVKHYGEQHPDRALIATDLAYLESRAGDEAAAKRLGERAVATLVATAGATAESTLLAKLALAGSSRKLGEDAAPCASYDEVATLARRSLGATRVLARALHGQGDCAQSRGELERAEELLREGLKISDDVSDGPELRAEAELRLAEVLVELRPASVMEARALASSAVRHLEEGKGNDAEIERAKRWLEEHPTTESEHRGE